MKIYNKLFAIIIAMLGVTTLKAQTDVTSTYLMNAGFDDESGWIKSNVGQNTVSAVPEWRGASTGDTWFYGGAIGYGSSLTVNSVTPPATNPSGVAEGGALGISAGWGCTVKYTQEVTLPAGVYTLTYKVYNANTAATQANNYIGFTSSSASYYGTTTSFAANTWVEESVNFVLTAETTGNISVGMGAISGGSGANAKLFVDGVTLTYKPFTDVTEANPVDLTSMISNTKAAWTGATETPSYDGITMVAVYKGSDWTGDALSQTINGLPAGKYEMEVYCQAHSSWDTDAAAEGATGYTYLKANEYSLDVPIRNADGATTKELYTFEDMTITSGSLTISVVNEQLAANWISVYVKSLTYLGPDKSLEEANLATNIAALNALSTNDVPTAFATKINDLKSAYGSADASTMTLNELMTANGDIKAVVDLHPSMVAAYANLNVYEAIYNNSEEIEAGAKALYKTALDQAKSDAANAVTVDAINNVITELEVARQTYVVKADPTNDTYFDYTFLMTNPAVANGNGWTGARTNSGQQYTGAPDNTYWDSWDGAGQNIYQELAGLPRGLYTLKAAGRASTSCTSAYIYLNDTKVEIEKLGSTGNDLGNGWKWYTTEKTAVAGTAKVGFGCNTASSQWAGADDFHLYFYGFDPATAQTDVATLKAEAEALVGKPMNAEIASALNGAIASADATKTTRLELQPMIDALSTAVANAKTWIAAYNEAKAPLVAAFERFEADYNDGANGPARAMTTDMWTTLLEAVKVAAVAKDVTDSYDGFAKAAEDFNAAMDAIDNAYAAEGLLQDMTHLIGNADCKANDAWPGSGRSTRTGEHWSGDANRVYFAQNHESGAARTQTVTLPKTGTYYLKVAVRAVEAGSYVDIIINGKSNKTTGAHGRVGGTIATDGTEWESVAAGIEAGKTFAKDNNGYGWVYKHIYFNAEAGEATIALSLSNFNSNREANVGGMELYYVTIGDELILDENSTSFGDVEGWYKSVAVNRTIKTDVWNTFVVPFDMEIPAGWEVKELTGSTANGDIITMKFEPAESIEAGVPYMVRVEEPVSSINVEEVFVKEGMVGSGTDLISFIGVYSKDYVPTGSFFISNNTFYRAADESNTLKAFRAYLQPKGGANIKAVGYSFDDVDATFVEDVEDAMTAEPVAVYGADGALRTGLQKGLNIVKMSDGKVKKVMVK